MRIYDLDWRLFNKQGEDYWAVAGRRVALYRHLGGYEIFLFSHDITIRNDGYILRVDGGGHPDWTCEETYGGNGSPLDELTAQCVLNELLAKEAS